jgi:alpha-glucosidase
MENLKRVIKDIQGNGFRTGLRKAYYALRRSRGNRWWQENFPADLGEQPGELEEFSPIPGGGLVKFQNAELEIIFLTPEIVRTTWTPGDLPPNYALDSVEWTTVETETRETGILYSVRSGALEVFVTLEGGLKYLNAEGCILRTEEPPRRLGRGWQQKNELHVDEHIYGLGSRAASFNHRGREFRMWNSDPGGAYDLGSDPLYVNIPVYLSIKRDGSYLIFYENAHDGYFKFGKTEGNRETKGYSGPDKLSQKATVQFLGGALRSYFISGSPAEVLERYTLLTGRHPMPPSWALGYHQSRWGYKSEKDIREVVAGFKEHDLPLDVIHLDIDYMRGYRVFTVDEDRFPDLTGLINDLGNEGIKVVTILDPGVKADPAYDVFNEGMGQDVFCKLPDGKLFYGLVWPDKCAFPDFTNPNVRQWWGGYYPRLLASGVAGIWHDMNEPVVFVSFGEPTFDMRTRHNLDGQEVSHISAHNLYAFQMNRAGYEALRTLRPEKRPWIISRAGWAGQQRYAWNWTGDIESTWSALEMTVAMVLNLGISGIAFTGPDIGGFSGEPAPELYVRWFELSTFLPFFRTHSAITVPRREPWTYGETVLSILRKYLKLRMIFSPYIYTAAWQTAQFGYPMVRPLFWDTLTEPALWDVADAFLFGDHILVAPVLEEGVESRTVLLSPGQWYHYWDDELLDGNAKYEIEAPLDRIPIFIRAGSVLALEEDGRMVLHVYPQAEGLGSSLLFQDAGDGYEEWRIDTFELVWEVNQLVLSRHTEGEFSPLDGEVAVQVHRLNVSKVWLDEGEEPLIVHGNRFTIGHFNRLRFEVRG